ncbi:hypothetical protein OAN81_06640 [Paracoccaceae bacterium]|nr:hypothetical protein [Paracoccaceae bacterium]
MAFIKNIAPREFILFLAMLTSSFDVFLVINLGPNFRITQLFILVLLFFVLLYDNTRKIIPPSYFSLLFLFFLLNFIFVLNSGYLQKGIAYALWLGFNLLTLFLASSVFYISSNYERLMKFYLLTFVIVGFFALVQFIMGFLGFGEFFLVKTWWIQNKIPRINGFSYEPSFFAAFLIIGWTMITWLNFKKVFIFTKNLQYTFTIIMMLPLVLSGSRLGIIMMALFYLYLFITILMNTMCSAKLSTKMSLFTPFFVTLLSAIVVSFIVLMTIDYRLLFMGLGASGNSVSIRSQGFMYVINIFFENPIIGVSLGGLSYYVAKAQGLSVGSFADAKIEGNGIILEIFAATGIIGGMLFTSYFCLLCVKSLKVSRRVKEREGTYIIAVLVSLITLWLILQPNQNVLRPYFWMHLGILSGLLSRIDRDETRNC